MQTKIHENNHQVVDFTEVLNQEFGAPGSAERMHNEELAYAAYAGQILQDARRAANITQDELAVRVGRDKSYIARLESGIIEPSVGLFLRIMEVLGHTWDRATQHSPNPAL